MPTNRNIVEMVEAIRKGTGGSNSADGVDGTYMADVLSVKPLTIKMHNTTITKNLYINPALMLNASDSGEDIKKPFITPFEPQEAYEFLKEFHEKYVLKKGDTVAEDSTVTSIFLACVVASSPSFCFSTLCTKPYFWIEAASSTVFMTLLFLSVIKTLLTSF